MTATAQARETLHRSEWPATTGGDAGPGVAGEKPLNAADRLMLVAHDQMRLHDHPGFTCQTHLWLNGRLDAPALRAALERLARRHPVAAARLVRSEAGAPAWRFGGPPPPLEETVIPDRAESSVLAVAERLASRPVDLDRDPPLSMHLLRHSSGDDVLILSFSHVLMDGKAPELVLREIDRLHDPNRADETSPDQATGLDFDARLGQAPRLRRLRCALRVVAGHLRLPVRSVSLSSPHGPAWVTKDHRIGLRELDERRTQILADRVRDICGFVNLCPAVLASAFRAIARLTPRTIRRRTVLLADVPLNLRPPGATSPLFGNSMSFIPLSARACVLADRDGLTGALSRQMREQLRRGIDLGNLQMMSVMSRFERSCAAHIRARMQHSPVSLGFGFLGPVAGLETFCGVPVSRLHTLNAALAPPGVTLQVNQFRGRLGLGLTYVSRSVPPGLAGEFLDTMMADLAAERG
jgi:hypothetical protein